MATPGLTVCCAVVYGGRGGGGCSQIISGHLERPAGASTYVSEGEKKNGKNSEILLTDLC